MVEIGDYRDKMLELECDISHMGPIVVHKSMLTKYDNWRDWKPKYNSDYRIDNNYYSSIGFAMKRIFSMSDNYEDIYIAPGYHKLSTWADALLHIQKLMDYKPGSNIYIHIGGRNSFGKDYIDKTAKNLILGKPIKRRTNVNINDIVSKEVLF